MACVRALILGSLSHIAASERVVSGGGWPLESRFQDGMHVPLGTCTFEDGMPFSRPEGCELVVYRASKLVYLRARVIPEFGRGFNEYLAPITEKTWYPKKAWGGGIQIEIRIPRKSIGLVFTPKGTTTYEEFMERFTEARASVESEAGKAAKSVALNFSSPCHSARPALTLAMDDELNSLELRWNSRAHHITVGIGHRDEEVQKPFWGTVESKDMLNGPERVTASPAPPSCYVREDWEEEPDCAFYEPHVSRVREVLACLGFPLVTAVEQKAAADFLRRLVFKLGLPRSPHEVAVAASLSAFEALQAFREGGSSSYRLRFALPGRAAECLGLAGPLAEATSQIQAVGCYLPMASVTGFGFMNSGIMDETPFDRFASIKRAVLLAGNHRLATAEEEKEHGHGKLAFPAAGKPEYFVNDPLRTVASIQAPPVCLRVVVEKLRPITFMTYDTYAKLGDPARPFESLKVPSMTECLQGSNYMGAFGSNCRYYVGCAIQLLLNFDRIPGVSRELVDICSRSGRRLELLDPEWMHADNEYWMSDTGAQIFSALTAVGARLFGGPQNATADAGPLAGPADLGVGPFETGDVVRIYNPGFVEHGQLHEVAHRRDKSGKSGKVCLRRGERPTGCWPAQALRLVPRSEWILEPGTGIPVDRPGLLRPLS